MCAPGRVWVPWECACRVWVLCVRVCAHFLLLQSLSLLPGGNRGRRQGIIYPCCCVPRPSLLLAKLCAASSTDTRYKNEVRLPPGWIKAFCTHAQAHAHAHAHAIVSDLLSKADRITSMGAWQDGPMLTSPRPSCPVGGNSYVRAWPLSSPPPADFP